MTIKRIAIIGCAGSGKTTLALKLASILNLRVYHLDKYYWKPNWTEPNYDEFLIIHDQLCDQPEWIIEGMNMRALPHRIYSADVIIFLDMPRWLCLWRVLKRFFIHLGKNRADRPELCPERLNLPFLQFIWNFNKRFKLTILNLLDAVQDSKKIYILKSAQEINNFVSDIKNNKFF